MLGLLLLGSASGCGEDLAEVCRSPLDSHGRYDDRCADRVTTPTVDCVAGGYPGCRRTGAGLIAARVFTGGVYATSSIVCATPDLTFDCHPASDPPCTSLSGSVVAVPTTCAAFGTVPDCPAGSTPMCVPSDLRDAAMESADAGP
ncbi:MAG TPA: hypothetical protein RMH99_10695 [Sandaracinaceae bacterium LLY-WYZ-13_1]|nr:hypothetical protein [Sandaracinaceae bacterium LLY-WYZ-13_1]